MWADLGENEGQRDPAHWRVRAFRQVWRPKRVRASGRGMEDIQAGGGTAWGLGVALEGVREALERVGASDGSGGRR